MSKFNRQPLAESLEPRLLFSADPIAAMFDLLPDQSGGPYSSRDLPDEIVASTIALLQPVEMEKAKAAARVEPLTAEAQLSALREVGGVHEAAPDSENQPALVNDSPFASQRLTLDAPVINQSNLLVNGDFNSGDLTGWTTTGTVTNTGSSEMRFGEGSAAAPHSAWQALSTQVGQRYTLSFEYRDDSAGANQSILVSVDGATNNLNVIEFSSTPGTTYRTITETFVADSTTTVLQFVDTSLSTAGVDGYIDSVSVFATTTFSAISEDDVGNSGDTVASILASAGGDLVTDPDLGAVEGIAVMDVSSAFDYSLDGGVSWSRMENVSDSNALLLRPDDRLRFVPNEIHAQSEYIEFRAWDQTAGAAGSYVSTAINGGATAFSSDIVEASIETTDVNDVPSFGSGGGFSVGYGEPGYNQNLASLALADGSILFTPYDINSDSQIGKLGSDGQLDVSFGLDGYFEPSSLEYIRDIQQQVDGRFLVTGETGSDLVLVRYLSDGSLDLGFGTAGEVSMSLGGNDGGHAIAIQADGSIVVVGESGSDSIVTRLTASGALDTSFDTDGSVILDLGNNFEELSSVSIMPDGRIVAAGETHVVRLTAAGVLDTGFDSDGILNAGHGVTGVVVQSDGSIVVTGFSGNDLVVSRFDVNGAVDTAFGIAGTGTWTDPGVLRSWGNNIIEQADGKLLAVGSAETNSAFGYELVAVRFNADGTLDTAFGTDGSWLSGLTYDYAEGYDVSLFDDGGQEKIVVGGYDSQFGFSRAVIARLNADGSLDTGFQSGLLDGNPTVTENGPAAVLDDNVQIFDRELNYHNDFGYTTLTLSRAGGADSDDVFGATGRLALVAGDIELDAMYLGTYTNSGGELSLSFDGSPTVEEVNAVMQAITYSNASDAPPNSVSVAWVFSDGNAGDQGSGGPQTVTGSTVVTVVPINDAPVALGNTLIVTEDASTLLGAAAFLFNDPEGDALSSVTLSNLDLQGGTLRHSGNSVAVSNGDQLSLAELADLTFTPQQDNMQSARFDYTVNDADVGVVSATLTLHIDRENDAPVITSFGGSDAVEISISENMPFIATITATDIDVPDSVQFSVSGPDSAAFSIHPVDGELRFVGGADFENPVDQGANNVYSVDVVATDQLGAEDRQSLTISVTDANDAPSRLQLSNTLVFDQTETTGGYEIGVLAGFDEDALDTLSFSLVGGRDIALFRLGGEQSDRLILEDGVVDIGARQNYEIEVRVTDVAGASYDQMFQISVFPNSNSLGLEGWEESGTGQTGSTGVESTVIVDVQESGLEEQAPPVTAAANNPESQSQHAPAGAKPDTPDSVDAPAIPDIPELPMTLGASSPGFSGIEGPQEAAVGLEKSPSKSSKVAQRTIELMPLKEIDLINLQLDNLENPVTAALLHIPDNSENQIFFNNLRRLGEKLEAAVDSDAAQQQFIRDISSGVTISLTAGLFSWMLKSGSLLASLMATIPVWKSVDPLPILSAKRRIDQDDVAESPEDSRVSDMFG